MRQITLFFLMLVGALATGQEFKLKKLKEVRFEDSIEHISVDRLGGFYITNCGKIIKFDPEGNLLNELKTTACTSFQLIEAWNPIRIFAFRKEDSLGKIKLFDHSLSSIAPDLKVEESFAVDPLLVAPGVDNTSYWILDLDYSIKRVDLIKNIITLETAPITSITEPHQFRHMREYQNFLFILDEFSGLYVLNKIGKVIKKIEAKGANYFSVLGEDIYFLRNKIITFNNFLTDETYAVPVPPETLYAVATDERLILFRKNIFDVFAFSPQK